MSVNQDTKISIQAGAVEFLIKEVEELRGKNAILSAETRVMNSFFSMVDRLGAKPTQGFEQDKLWQAKKEFQAGILAATPKPEGETK